MDTRPSPWRLWSALLAIYFVWGSTYVAIRIMVEDIPPLLGGGVRFVIAGAVMLAVLAARGRRIRLSRGELAGAALIGALLPACGNGLVTLAERDVPAGFAALLIASVPLWVVLLRATAGGERIAGMTLAGVAAGFAGVAVLLAPGSQPAEATAVGIVLLLVAALGWSTGSFLSSRVPAPETPLVGAAWQMLLGGAMLLVGAAILGEPGDLRLGAISTDAWLAFGYLVAAGSWVAFTAYAWLLRNAPISQVSTYAYVNPIVAVALGWALLGETLNPTAALGALLTLAAVAAIVRREGSGQPTRRRGEPAEQAV